jgi:hypothetical protein
MIALLASRELLNLFREFTHTLCAGLLNWGYSQYERHIVKTRQATEPCAGRHTHPIFRGEYNADFAVLECLHALTTARLRPLRLATQVHQAETFSAL